MDKPKKPASGFLRFLKEAYASSNKENRGEFREFHKKIAINWHELPEEKKNAYNDASKAETVTYRQELAKWELKMVRLGNIDLVRQEALIEQEPKAPRAKARAKASKSDWELGWCAESPIDVTQQSVISSKLTNLSSHPAAPLSADDEQLLNPKHHEKQEMKSPPIGESDTTSDNPQIKISSTIQPSKPEPEPATADQPNKKSKETVMNKFKDFFKF